ncbi:MAG: hypothetical protein HYS04_21200 [Acidobacteria bacterium]|nr:hypothetical protein [Acidobacteriota bacterium]
MTRNRRLLVIAAVALAAPGCSKKTTTVPSPPAPRREASRAETPRRTRPKPAPAAEAAAEGPQQNPPSPPLVPVLSAKEREELSRSIDQALERARRAAADLHKHTLNAEQGQTLSRVETFLRQAQEARATDLKASWSFAERADLLSQELLRSLR